ncbi:MAG: Gfo/Idh/MocA family oxidoreductase, partial [Halobacteriovoraceae bacterium]|nr:Gfo/Idh/MocA family oxidoreductase [Halobacteriovoraceae bacterium]
MKFGIVGVGGYIAPRHLKAIQECGGELVVAMDPVDSVGILDRDFHDVEFFLNEKEFENYITQNKIDYLTICSPNYKHKEHILMGLRAGANIICEKPLVLELADLEEIRQAEKASGKTVATILQLRVHPSIRALRDEVLAADPGKKYQVDLSYITSRGPWFHKSWKGDVAKSGGLPTNIGVHFFDMLSWLFGDIQHSELHSGDAHVYAGYMEYERAEVRWF